MSKLVLKNQNGSSADIVLENKATNAFKGKTIDASRITTFVDKVEDLATVESHHDVVIVKDKDRGGIFYWDGDINPIGLERYTSGSLAYYSDGGIKFAPSNVTSGAWVRQYSGVVNVKWFGAKGGELGDNFPDVDNTPYILAAINSLPLLGGIVYIDTHYRMKTTLKLHNHIGVVLQGTGNNTSSSLRFTEDVVGISVEGNTEGSYYGFGMKDLWVSGYHTNISDGTKNLIEIKNTYLCNLNMCYFEDGSTCIYIEDVKDFMIDNCRIEGPSGIYVTGDFNNSSITNIWSANIGREGNSPYSLKIDAVSSHNVIFNNLNLRSSNGTNVLYIKDTNGINLSNINIKNGYSGVRLENSTKVTLTGLNVYSDNSLFNAVQFSGTNSNHCITDITIEDTQNIVQFVDTPVLSECLLNVNSYMNVDTVQLSSEGLNIKYTRSKMSELKVSLSTTQTVTEASFVAFDTVKSHTDLVGRLVLNGTNEIVVKEPGFYMIIANIDFRAMDTDSTATVQFFVNGASGVVFTTFEGSASSNTTNTPNGSTVIYLNNDDAISCKVSSTDGDIDINTSRTFMQVISL